MANQSHDALQTLLLFHVWPEHFAIFMEWPSELTATPVTSVPEKKKVTQMPDCIKLIILRYHGSQGNIT